MKAWNAFNHISSCVGLDQLRNVGVDSHNQRVSPKANKLKKHRIRFFNLKKAKSLGVKLHATLAKLAVSRLITKDVFCSQTYSKTVQRSVV